MKGPSNRTNCYTASATATPTDSTRRLLVTPPPLVSISGSGTRLSSSGTRLSSSDGSNGSGSAVTGIRGALTRSGSVKKHKMSSFMDSHESEEPLGDDAVGAGYGAGHLNAGTVG